MKTSVFSCINHKQITLLQKCINRYHQCKNAVYKFWSRPIQILLWILKGTVLGSFEHSKQIFKLMGKSIQFYSPKVSFSGP